MHEWHIFQTSVTGFVPWIEAWSVNVHIFRRRKFQQCRRWANESQLVGRQLKILSLRLQYSSPSFSKAFMFYFAFYWSILQLFYDAATQSVSCFFSLSSLNFISTIASFPFSYCFSLRLNLQRKLALASMTHLSKQTLRIYRESYKQNSTEITKELT